MKRKYLASFMFITVLMIGLLNFFMHYKGNLVFLVDKNTSLASFFSGKIAKDIEKNYSDNFTFKKELMALSSLIQTFKGISNDLEIVDSSGMNVDSDFNDELVKDTKFGSILIVDNIALELNRYSELGIKEYADVLNRVVNTVDKERNVYSILVPTQIEFNEKEIAKELSYSQRSTINEVYKSCLGVKTVDVYDSLKNHSAEYIYFRTDHHWTQLGAYYAYVKFAEEIGVSPIDIKELKSFKIEDFLGSLYRVTHKNKKLLNSVDFIEVYEQKSASKMYKSDDSNTKALKIVNKAYVYGEQKYSVFLNGDSPMLYIDSDVDNEKSIVIIKDSYANAFIPFLTNHYKRIYVIDPRHWKGNLYSFINEKNIDDILFFNYALITQYGAYDDVIKKILGN